jgi:hypothetical protein
MTKAARCLGVSDVRLAKTFHAPSGSRAARPPTTAAIVGDRFGATAGIIGAAVGFIGNSLITWINRHF